MVQANTGGVVVEPDPMVLMMMIQMVAKFRGWARSTVRAHADDVIELVVFYCFCVLYCLFSVQCGRSGVNNNVLVQSSSIPHPPSLLALGVRASCTHTLLLM